MRAGLPFLSRISQSGCCFTTSETVYGWDSYPGPPSSTARGNHHELYFDSLLVKLLNHLADFIAGERIATRSASHRNC